MVQLLTRTAGDQMKHLASVFESATRGFLRDHCTSAAASLAFYALISGFPLLLLAVDVASLVLEPEEAAAQAEEVLRRYVPVGSDIIEGSLQGAVGAGGAEVGTAGLSLLALLVSGTFVFTEITRALDIAWGVRYRRPFRRALLIDCLLVVAMAGLVSGAMLYETEGARLPRAGIAGLVVRPLPQALGLALVLLAYRYLPLRQVRWSDALAGALVVSALFAASQLLFRSYVALFGSRFQEVYGPLGSVAALLVWAYITAAIFLFGAEFSAARGRDRTGPVWVEHTPIVKKTDKLLR